VVQQRSPSQVRAQAKTKETRQFVRQVRRLTRRKSTPRRRCASCQGPSEVACRWMRHATKSLPTATLEGPVSSAQLATQGDEGPPAGMRDSGALGRASPDHLPRKQKTALRRPSPCMRCNV
jgi:hypothetical protein